MSTKMFVITRDSGGSSGNPLYFIRLGLGIFWECTHNLSEARKFHSRANASKTLVGSGKNRDGWRVIPVNV